MIDLELLSAKYSIEPELNGRKIPPLIISIAVKREVFSFKLQATTNWLDKSFN